MKKLMTVALLFGLTLNLNAMEKGNMKMMVDKMPQGMQMKLKFDYVVNLPILMRAVMKNGETLGLSKEQKIAIKKHKLDVMDGINPIMKEAHMLSKKLKDSLLYGSLSKEEAEKLAQKITKLKESVLQMKIICIDFLKSTLTKEQFTKLIELDKKMPYLNSPYSY
jgi:hypothetical protein